MKEAGAEARWRSNDANTVDSSSGVPVDGSTFYESESDASTESADESGGLTPPDSSRFIYEATLAGHSYQRSLTEILGTQTDLALSDTDDDIGKLFPATDQADLSPTVFVSSTHENKFVSNNQNAQLAELLEFGGVPGDDEESVAPSSLSARRNGQFSDRGRTLSSPQRQRKMSFARKCLQFTVVFSSQVYQVIARSCLPRVKLSPIKPKLASVAASML